jgi:hypothetical protein
MPRFCWLAADEGRDADDDDDDDAADDDDDDGFGETMGGCVGRGVFSELSKLKRLRRWLERMLYVCKISQSGIVGEVTLKFVMSWMV